MTREWRGVLQYIKEKDQLLRHHIPEDQKVNKSRITDLSIDEEGSVWLATGRGLARFDPDADAFEFCHSATSDLVKALDFGENGSVWILMKQLMALTICHSWIQGQESSGSSGIARTYPGVTPVVN